MRSDLEVSDILDNAICRIKKVDRPIGQATVICLPEANPEFLGRGSRELATRESRPSSAFAHMSTIYFLPAHKSLSG